MGWRLLPPSWQVAWLKGTLLQAAYIFTRELAQQVSVFSRGFSLKDLSHEIVMFFILFYVSPFHLDNNCFWQGCSTDDHKKCNSHTICFAFVLKKTVWAMARVETWHLQTHYNVSLMQIFTIHFMQYPMKALWINVRYIQPEQANNSSKNLFWLIRKLRGPKYETKSLCGDIF